MTDDPCSTEKPTATAVEDGGEDGDVDIEDILDEMCVISFCNAYRIFDGGLTTDVRLGDGSRAVRRAPPPRSRLDVRRPYFLVKA